MDKIRIRDLEVFYHVGVTEEERAKPQRLLLSIEMEHDFTSAISRDDLAETLDYFAISQRLLRFGDDCHWQLIETLAAHVAAMIQDEFHAQSVSVEVKKFVIPQAAYVSVALTRPAR
jgi:FolB domain-containing protein